MTGQERTLNTITQVVFKNKEDKEGFMAEVRKSHESVRAVAGASDDTSEGTASTNSARRPMGAEEDERAARVARTVARMSAMKRKTNTKKSKK